MLKTAKDDLLCTTEYIPHEDDDKRNNEEDDNTFDVDEIADMFLQLDTLGVRKVDNTKRRLSLIGKRHDIVQHDIPNCMTEIPDIAKIPENIKTNINAADHTNNKTQLVQHINNQHIHNANKTICCSMIIYILNDVVLRGLPFNQSLTNDMQATPLNFINNLSFEAIIQKYRLNFNQGVSFEIMGSHSFLSHYTLKI